MNFQDFQDVYARRGIDTRKLGCVMLDLKFDFTCPEPLLPHLYTSPDPAKFWINGWVAGSKAHCTLLYGLLDAKKEDVYRVLDSWSAPSAVLLGEVGYFPSPYPNEQYWCLKADIEVSNELREGHQRLSLLPHINTFPEYRPHMTLGYVQCSEETRDEFIHHISTVIAGFRLAVGDLDLGSVIK